MMKILVLGAGPAGLFSAHAAATLGHDVIVMSKPRKSFMHGAQYLHRPIPALSQSDSFTIRYELSGEILGYQEKVYGTRDMRGKKVSPEDLLGTHSAWDIREAYDNAWAAYGSSVLPLEISPGGDDIAKVVEWAGADVVISTVPATLLCRDPQHVFSAERVWATDSARAIPDSQDNLVICSGERDVPWYRQSRIQGWENTEYPEKTKPPVSKVWDVVKPVHTTCNCSPDILRMGRYGLWEKGVLSDGAYYSTTETLASWQGTLL